MQIQVKTAIAEAYSRRDPARLEHLAQVLEKSRDLERRGLLRRQEYVVIPQAEHLRKYVYGSEGGRVSDRSSKPKFRAPNCRNPILGNELNVILGAKV